MWVFIFGMKSLACGGRVRAGHDQSKVSGADHRVPWELGEAAGGFSPAHEAGTLSEMWGARGVPFELGLEGYTGMRQAKCLEYREQQMRGKGVRVGRSFCRN